MHMEGNGDSAEEFCQIFMHLKGKALNYIQYGGAKKASLPVFPL